MAGKHRKPEPVLPKTKKVPTTSLGGVLKEFWRNLREAFAFSWGHGADTRPSGSQSYDKDGTYLVPRVQTPEPRRYVAPEDIERYGAKIGGAEFDFEVLPEEGNPYVIAVAKAREIFGIYADTQPVTDLVPLNENAAMALYLLEG
jgi:hypothetical protein